MFLIKKILYLTLCATLLGANDHKEYCAALKKITIGMEIAAVFNILGVPSSFSIPDNLDLNAIQGKDFKTKPSNSLDDPNVKPGALQQHPIFSAFNEVMPEQINTLSWSFEKDQVQITIRLNGTKVISVVNNQGCNNE